jgi:Domain of Unknown Function (DUF928)
MSRSNRFAAIVAGTTSILLVQLFPFVNSTVQPWSAGLTTAALASASSSAKSLFSLPVDSKPRRSQGSGSRGCDQGDLAEVTLLIPSQDVAGQTVLGHPSFFLYLPKSVSVPIKFTLSRPGGIDPIYETEITAPEAGITKLELPTDRPELSADDMYMWSVMLVCNEKRPSANPYYFSWVERVSETPALAEELAAATTDRDRAAIYARSGAWYDALATLYQARSENPDDLQIQADLNALLAEVGLTEVAQNP